MNELQIFKFEENQVRVIEVNGEPWFVAKDVCDVLGYANNNDAINKHVDDEDKGVAKCDTLGGMQNFTTINESGLYSLILSSKLPTAKQFKHWVTSEVIPSIRKTGSYIKKLSPVELLLEQAKLLVEQDKRISDVENKVHILEAKAETHPESYFTIAGYASLRGIKIDVSYANLLGRRAVKQSKKYGYEVFKTKDQRFGSVNTYHEDILKKVFDDEGRFN